MLGQILFGADIRTMYCCLIMLLREEKKTSSTLNNFDFLDILIKN